MRTSPSGGQRYPLLENESDREDHQGNDRNVPARTPTHGDDRQVENRHEHESRHESPGPVIADEKNAGEEREDHRPR